MTSAPGGSAFGATRRDARERAMELLYEAEVKTLTAAKVLDELPIEPDPYAAELVRGIERNQPEHDALIRKFAKKEWSLERMPQIDRIVLRIGIEELAHHPEVPLAVILDQAVELAKTFSTDDSGRFVNGMLAAVAREIRPAT
jgi:transcription antitermination protein NusB